ncbi:hypothetical protein, partial [Weizmannia sp. CD-2023]|uniref:hypothetical protein n=1 Tax=Weizmannia sp. CD-2023 TaxID=3037263 RepID=UPI002DBDC12F
RHFYARQNNAEERQGGQRLSFNLTHKRIRTAQHFGHLRQLLKSDGVLYFWGLGKSKSREQNGLCSCFFFGEFKSR